jgi:phospholipid-binding lipoprotein MlaA
VRVRLFPKVIDRALRAKRSAGLTPASAALVIVCLLAGPFGCAGANHANGVRDPLEGLNRVTDDFNQALDWLILRPASKTYTSLTPQTLQTGVSNFFDNLGYVNVILNDFLQGKFTQGVLDFWRLFLNSTLGFAGFYDIAATQGFEKHDEDFGQTLGVWGFGEGFYLMLPLFGPSTLRDAPGLVVRALTSPVYYVEDPAIKIPLVVMGAVDERTRVTSAMNVRDQAAIDPYIFTREAYIQRRTYLIHDGDPPLDDMFEEDWEDEEEEDEEK